LRKSLRRALDLILPQAVADGESRRWQAQIQPSLHRSRFLGDYSA